MGLQRVGRDCAAAGADGGVGQLESLVLSLVDNKMPQVTKRFLKKRNILSKAGIHLFSESEKFFYRFYVCWFKISGK